MSGRRNRGNFGLILLGSQLLNVGVNRIPPVTLALIAAQTAIFMDVFPKYFPSATAVCMSSYIVWYHKKWERLFLSAVFHADDMHLYFNMSSLIWKGIFLEKKFKSVYFAYLVSVFTALTSIVYIGLNILLENVLEDHSYGMQCAVGFSGVLFALKVLVTHYTPPGRHLALGFIPVPSRWIYWVELILIQLVTPNASFTGHLAGILVGLFFIKGPLKPLMDSIISPEMGNNYRYHGTGYSSGNSQSSNYIYTDRGGYSRTTPSAPPPEYGFRQEYTGGLSEDEQYRRAQRESLQQQTNQRLYPDLDELRKHRMRHYN
ncbi:rhomboid-related protein 4 [Patella vulgata]|uniref:rhomboid-related protein 4 n=1 Tax=Patella vulgata TaxID=6465 RepID=UPI0021808726|nr:rhomboid-related protein 4 [Patella vulgata]XP_050418159.1 rhomboid-related protein 4 [Patella vulgata]XP_050418162.1 rhomboid-related protein 4 [Patella vulgata]